MKPIGYVKSIEGRAFPEPVRKRKLRGRHICAAFLVLIAALLLINSFPRRNEPPPAPPIPQPTLDYPDFFAQRSEYLDRFSIKQLAIKEDETPQQVFTRFGLTTDAGAQWQKSCRDFFQFNLLKPGDRLSVKVDKHLQQPVRFDFSSDGGSTYTFWKLKTGWMCDENVVPSVKMPATAAGSVGESFYDSCIRSGLTPELIVELTNLFAWDIDFSSDLGEADTFSVYFDQEVREGKRIGTGPILAAQMVVGGKPYQAFFYKLPDGSSGYFDAKGMSLRKLFLRTPLNYGRLISSFPNKQAHLVSRTVEAHSGIDYGAPAGAPVCAPAEGTITFLGKKGSLGRFIEIRHPSSYKTSYGHLLAFTEGLHSGSKVSQGDIIGFVGSSGRVKGNHLDFRFYKNRKPADFLESQFAPLKSIPKSARQDFEKKRDSYLSALREKPPAQQGRSLSATTN